VGARAPAGTWTAERIVAALKDWTRLVGSPPRSYEWAPSSARVLRRESPRSRLWAARHPRWPSTATVARHFGTWNAALSAAGLPLRRPPAAPASGREERIELAQRLARSGLGSGEIAAILDVSPRTVRAYLGAGRCVECGTWVVTSAERCPPCAARRARPPERSRERVLDALTAWTRETGRPPTQADWPSLNGTRWPSYMTVTTHFGSWRAALEAAGLRPNRRQWSREEIVEALRVWTREHGRPPRQHELVYGATGLPTPHTIRRRFGSYAAALEAALDIATPT
jgi:DNA-binding CsgD family transcriptional regulator